MTGDDQIIGATFVVVAVHDRTVESGREFHVLELVGQDGLMTDIVIEALLLPSRLRTAAMRDADDKAAQVERTEASRVTAVLDAVKTPEVRRRNRWGQR